MDKRLLTVLGWTTVFIGAYMIHKGSDFHDITTVDNDHIIDADFEVLED